MRVEADTQISECSALMRLESVGAVLRYVEGDAGDGDGGADAISCNEEEPCADT